MSGNFVHCKRERQCIVYIYIIYVNNTLLLALAVHEISRHFWAAYDIIQLKQAAAMVTKYLLKRKKMYNNEATARNH